MRESCFSAPTAVIFKDSRQKAQEVRFPPIVALVILEPPIISKGTFANRTWNNARILSNPQMRVANPGCRQAASTRKGNDLKELASGHMDRQGKLHSDA